MTLVPSAGPTRPAQSRSRQRSAADATAVSAASSAGPLPLARARPRSRSAAASTAGPDAPPARNAASSPAVSRRASPQTSTASSRARRSASAARSSAARAAFHAGWPFDRRAAAASRSAASARSSEPAARASATRCARRARRRQSASVESRAVCGDRAVAGRVGQRAGRPRSRLGAVRAAQSHAVADSGPLASKLALGFRNLVADVYWMRAVVYYGGKRRDERAAADYAGQLRAALSVARSGDVARSAFQGRVPVWRHLPDRGLPERAWAAGPRRSRCCSAASTTTADDGSTWRISASCITGGSATSSRRRSGSSAPASSPGAPSWLAPLAATTLAEGGDRRSSRFLWTQLSQNTDIEWLRRNGAACACSNSTPWTRSRSSIAVRRDSWRVKSGRRATGASSVSPRGCAYPARSDRHAVSCSIPPAGRDRSRARLVACTRCRGNRATPVKPPS